eukprot:Amastigsp_a676780_96.p7 type:complete len:101 gc:universal Amastigsp_a676780_96:1537-1235(-)
MAAAPSSDEAQRGPNTALIWRPPRFLLRGRILRPSSSLWSPAPQRLPFSIPPPGCGTTRACLGLTISIGTLPTTRWRCGPGTSRTPRSSPCSTTAFKAVR